MAASLAVVIVNVAPERFVMAPGGCGTGRSPCVTGNRALGQSSAGCLPRVMGRAPLPDLPGSISGPIREGAFCGREPSGGIVT